MRSGFLGRGIGPNAFGGAAADWWVVAGQTCVAAYQPIGAASLAASYVNLANPGTYNAAPGVAPGLAAGGWSFNGSSQYLATGIVPENNQQWSAIVRYAGFSLRADFSELIAAGEAGIAFGITLGKTVADRIIYANGGNNFKATAPAAATLAIAGSRSYRNGADDGIAIPTYIGSFSAGLNIGVLYTLANRFFLGTIAAVAIYSTTLSASDVAALTARMAALA